MADSALRNLPRYVPNRSKQRRMGKFGLEEGKSCSPGSALPFSIRLSIALAIGRFGDSLAI